MATPISQFLSSFAAAHSGVRSSRPDPLREMAFQQDVIRYREAAPQREANLRLVQAQADRMELANQTDRRTLAQQEFAGAELRANELGGLVNSLGDPVFKQRLLRAVNLMADEDNDGTELVDYERINRSNINQWGITPEQFDSMLSQHNPNHRLGEDDDEILMPIYRRPNGEVSPLDIDGDGQLETWSAEEAVQAIRGMFVGSDEIGGALQSLNTGNIEQARSSVTQVPSSTGRVTPTSNISADPQLAPPPEIGRMIQESAERHGVPANVLAALAQVESSYNPNAVNEEFGATGIMQYIPETARSLGIDPRDPAQSIDAAAMQIAERLAMGETIEEAIQHHHSGPNREGWGPNTRDHLEKVLSRAERIGGITGQQADPQQAVSSDAILSVNQVTEPGQPEPQQPVSTGTGGRQNLPPSLQTADDLEESQRRITNNIRQRFGGAAAEVTEGLPVSPNESDETALGVPRDQLPEEMSRGARRVSEGKGISPAQAKELALDPSQLPAPTPRSTIAAGARVMEDMEESDGEFRAPHGNRPTHQQLTAAVILNRAGVLDSDALNRYADLGVISDSGVAVIQTSMQQLAQTQRQAMSDTRALQQEQMRQQGAMERVFAQEQLRRTRPGQDDTTLGRVFDQNQLAAQLRLEAMGAPQDVAEEASRRVAAKLTNMGARSQAFQTNDWQNPRNVEAMAKAEAFDREWNEAGLSTRLVRALRGVNVELGLSDNPLAILLLAEDSNLMDLEQDRSFWENVGRSLPGVGAVMQGMEDVPRFMTEIHEPMVSTARRMGLEGFIDNNPDLQMRIFDAATVGLQEQMRAEGREILNDSAAIQRAVMTATEVYLESLGGRNGRP